MGADDFIQFLQDKKDEGDKNSFNRKEREKEWLNSINNLYSQIKLWLNPVLEKKLASIDEKNIYIHEGALGQYSTSKLCIYIGNDIVSLTPIGAIILGSRGRIDMEGPKSKLILIQPTVNNWEFVKRSPQRVTWSFTEDSFKKAIQYVINGE